jgi:hypothetical protein
MADCAKLVEAAVSQRSKKHWYVIGSVDRNA